MLIPPENFGLVEPGLYRCSKLSSDNFPHLQTLNLKTIILLDAENPPRSLKNFINDNNITLKNLGSLKISNHNHTGANNIGKNDDDKESIRKSSGEISNETTSPNFGQSYQSKASNPIENSDMKELNLQLINLNNTTKKNDQWMLIERNVIIKAFEILLNKTKYNILIVDSTSTLISILRRIQKWNFNSIVGEFRIYSGNSAKSHYFAENFLELIEIELVPFEIDQLNQFLKSSHQLQQHQQLQSTTPIQASNVTSYPGQHVNGQFQSPRQADLSFSPDMFRTTSWHKNSIDDESLWEKEMVDDDDFDDDLLSASPQIPENLLKMVEKKRNNSVDSDDDKIITPGSSPRYIVGRYNDTRRPSEPKITRHMHNSVFRSSFSSNANTPNIYSPSNTTLGSYNGSGGCGKSFDSTSFTNRRYSKTDRKPLFKDDDFDEVKFREKFNFEYYKDIKSNLDNVGIIKLKLPATNKLPDWFINGRDFWEYNYRKKREQN